MRTSRFEGRAFRIPAGPREEPLNPCRPAARAAEPSGALARSTTEASPDHEEVLVAEQRAGYGRRWPKLVAIYLAMGVVAYLIVYFVFLNGGSASGGSGGSGGGGYFVLALPALARSAFVRRHR
jgi:hypothetical protein